MGSLVRRAGVDAADCSQMHNGDPLLRVTGLTKRFGGLTAVRDTALEVAKGELHAVIGPNGAGKSTLIDMLSGEVKPTAGSIRLAGIEIAGWRADRIARLGVGRSYQRTNLFPRFTAFENCRLAAQSRLPSSMRFFRPAGSVAALNNSAERALRRVSLGERANVPAEILSHGERRQLEIAMTLATEPRLLLLDEPLAGTGAEEAALIVSLLKRLAANHAIILVEHDMDAVFALADRITVMVDGAVIACGEPATVRADPVVQEAYLGAAEASASDAA
jgi:branched-chain amino acid transport system ATP-binding protein